jgi:hypothetical protein
MATHPYSLENWHEDFCFFAQHDYQHISRNLLPEHLAEIKEHFRREYPEEAEFLFHRVSALVSFLAKNIDAFAVNGTAMPASEAVNISPAVRFALWIYFIADDKKFDPEPDAQAVLELAEMVAKARYSGRD